MDIFAVREEEKCEGSADRISSGMLRISLAQPPKPEETVTTDWIDTGLGKNVAFLKVEIAQKKDNITYWGESGLFMPGDLSSKIRIGEMLDETTGRFRTAVCFPAGFREDSICLRWVAVSADAVTEAAVTPEETQIPAEKNEVPETFYIENPPKLLHPGWKYTLRTNLGSGHSLVTWSVPEGAGTIDNYGEYTAPERQGLYEVAASYDGGKKKATVYVVVMR